MLVTALVVLGAVAHAEPCALEGLTLNGGRNRCDAGEVVALSAQLAGSDSGGPADACTLDWQVDVEGVTVASGAGPRLEWECSCGEVDEPAVLAEVVVVSSSREAESSWAFGELWVDCATSAAAEPAGCGHVPGSTGRPGSALAVLGMLVLGLTRRRGAGG